MQIGKRTSLIVQASGRKESSLDFLQARAASRLLSATEFLLGAAVVGLILGAAYLVAGRNLWASILAHGFIDTYGVVVLYFGLDA